MSFRPTGTDLWKEATPLWFDQRDLEYRGSIIGLAQDTEYQIRLILAGKEKEFKSKTLSETFNVGKTTQIEHGTRSESLHITESGSPDAYHLITPVENAHATIDVKNHQTYTAIIDADYVIFRGIELKNAKIHGIVVKSGRHHMKQGKFIQLIILFFISANWVYPVITKGPYIIKPGQNSMTIMWESDVSEEAVVWYGANFHYYLRPTEGPDRLWFSYDYGPAHFVSLDYRGADNP